MNKVLTLIGLFNFADWIIALFIAGTTWRIEGRAGDRRRPILAVGLSVFFAGFALVRFLDFVNLVMHGEELRRCLGLIPTSFNVTATMAGALRTLLLCFTWYAVSLEVRDRRGILSGNVIRNWMARMFSKLR
jgi:hypothetical protein